MQRNRFVKHSAALLLGVLVISFLGQAENVAEAGAPKNSEESRRAVSLPNALLPDPIIISFETLSTTGPGQAGQELVHRQFATAGITFLYPAVFDYAQGLSTPGFAHSGTKAIERCTGQPSCTEPFEIDFTSPQHRVKIWIGFSRPLNETRTVVLHAFAGGVELGRDSATLNPSAAPQPIRTPLEVTVTNPAITAVTVAFSTVDIPMDGLAIDDVEFDTSGPPPPCQNQRNPIVSLDDPANGLTVETNEFSLHGNIASLASLESAIVTARGATESRSIDLLSARLVSESGGRFDSLQVDSLLFVGTNTVTVRAQDCRGSGESSATVQYRPREEYWKSVGPFGIPLSNNDWVTGQINSLAIHPRDYNTIYIGAAEGGVWKTTNGGQTWIPLTDTQLKRILPSGQRRGTTSIGAVALSPQNPEVIYAGTGDPHRNLLPGDGLGIFRSTDGGINWTPTGLDLARSECANGLMSQSVVNRITIRQANTIDVFAATNSGLFKYSEDGRDCWRLVTDGIPTNVNVSDLVSDRFQGTLYAAVASQGIFKTTDAAGEQWRQLTLGLPPPFSGFGSIALAFGGTRGVGFTTPQPIVYAGFDPGNLPNPHYLLFKTIDGERWDPLPSPPNDQQLSFNNTIAVGTFVSDEVYVGQIALWRAFDGGVSGGLNDYTRDEPITGNSWTNLSCCLGNPNPYRTGLDLHGDLHDIEFAPSTSFEPNPSQLQVVYVATDGGISKGVIDWQGRVTWQSLSQGLALGQCGIVAVSPADPIQVGCGLWHNGTSILFAGGGPGVQVYGGDGFQEWIDATRIPTTIYYNCNAGYGGKLCRNTLRPHTVIPTAHEIIWNDDFFESGGPWTDPYRSGHLLRVQRGRLVRNQTANTQAAGELQSLNAWEDIDPPGKSGGVTQVAFGRRRAFTSPIVYYVGTDSGQIWRGSPEVGWTKICECGGSVTWISVDLNLDERIVVIFKGVTSGQIREFNNFSNGIWRMSLMDQDFVTELQVNALTCVEIDPLDSSKVYVGTDQGMYRGRKENNQWVWTRSAGIPNVWVRSLQVHGSFDFPRLTGSVYAATFGRGIYELERTPPIAPIPFVLQPPVYSVRVDSFRIGEEGGPSVFNAVIPVTSSALTGKFVTPIDFSILKGVEITLQAPEKIQFQDQILRFAGWAVDGHSAGRNPRLRVPIGKNTQILSYYEKERTIPDAKIPLPEVKLSASAQQVCQQHLSHRLSVSLSVAGGQPPISLSLEIIRFKRQAEVVGLRNLVGFHDFLLNEPSGGEVQLTVAATDQRNKKNSAKAVVQLKRCK
jgi:hypothetical protein